MKRKLVMLLLLIATIHPSVSVSQALAQEPSQSLETDAVVAKERVHTCTTRNMDVRVLPEFISGFIHIVPIEFSNIDAGPCNVPPELTLALTPTQTEQLGTFDGSSSSKYLRPHETIHSLLVWSPKPREGALCPTYDGFELGQFLASSPHPPPMLTVRHLNIRTCHLFSTGFRVGVYVPGELVPTVWFDSKPHSKPLSIGKEITLATAKSDSAVGLEAPTPQPVLGDRVNLLLRLPRSPLPACPYSVFRARRSNGETFVYFDRCDPSDPPPPEQGFLIALRQLDLLATTGEIRFDTIVQISPTTYTQSSAVTINIRTRQAPDLPLVSDDNAICTSEDLKLAPATAPLHNERRVAEAFEFRNDSSHTCRIGGVPLIEPLNRVRAKDGKYRAEPWPASICPNCDDPLFSARPNVWIDLAPGDSAHFLVGHTLRDTLGEIPPLGNRCPVRSGLQRCGWTPMDRWGASGSTRSPWCHRRTT